MTKIYVWPDASYLDADEYNEVEFNHKGEDLITIDLQEIVDGRTALVYTGSHVELVLKGRLAELLQAEHQLKALTTMFHNYRTTMREYSWQIPHLKETIEQQQKDYDLALSRITDLEASPPSAEVRRLNKELSDVIAKHETEMRTTLQARDQWVKELQVKLHTAHEKATFCAKERDECAAKVDSLETLLSELYQVLGALDAPAKVLDLVTKVLDGHGFDPETDSLLPFYIEVQPIRPEDDWEYRARTAEAELAKLKNTSAISSDIEDSLRKERNRYGDLLTKHGVCTDCGDMYEHHEDEPFASCSCHTAEWGSGVSTPYMALQRALREARDAEHLQAEKVDALEYEINTVRHNASAAIAMLQEIE